MITGLAAAGLLVSLLGLRRAADRTAAVQGVALGGLGLLLFGGMAWSCL